MIRINLDKRTDSSLGYFDPETLYSFYDEEYKLVKRIYHKDIDLWIHVAEDEHYIEFVRSSDFKRIMCMTLSPSTKRSKSYHVDIVRMDKQFRGKGLAPLLYKYLVTYTDYILQAGECQSPGGRYIWNTLCDMNGVSVYGRFKYGQWYQMHKGEEEPEMDFELASTLVPYSNDREFYMYMCRG